MPTLEDAIALAVQVHRGQVDRVGRPYILHPLRVMLRLDEDTDRIVGILHDVVEDSEVTFDDLRAMGYSEEVVVALDGVTRREGESYEDFVERSRLHPISRRVKLADLADNMDVTRFAEEMSNRDFQRLERYRAAWRRLSEGE